ncbi:MAG: PAS domain S-box protein [Oligoflexia bacterium]|nr:PAS domain S-box protein [Oligoflexia bacterium]
MLDPARELASYKHALDQAAIVAITDKAGRIIYVNDKFVQISGYSREELIGKTHRIINSGYHPKEFFSSMWEQISQGNAWSGEVCNRTKNGSLYWVATTIIPFLDEDSKPYQYVAIRFEVTDKKNAESQVIFQDRLASVGLLASSLAHEIGTPLGVMRGRAELFKMQCKDNEAAKDGVEIIIQQIDRISGLIKSLLNLARGESSAKHGAGSIAVILRDVISLMHHEFKKHSIEIEFNILDSHLIKIGADTKPLHQVFLNLLVNAVHAIDSEIKSGKSSRHKIKIYTTDEDKFWAVHVEDTGCGISDKNMKNIFKPFFTTKDVGVGTGLGLVTSYRIVEGWGGVIKVKSQKGQGTTVSVFLPKG